jgi:ABC-type Mn2+/Zn2+ transport system permease subunit
MVLSVVIGAASGFVGMYASYYVDVSSGANIVLTDALAFVAALACSALRNRLTAGWRLASRLSPPERTLFE